MKQANRDQSTRSSNEQSVDFHGASIVTTTGKEIPITEQMLESSFNTLIEAWEKSRRHNKR